MRRLTIERDREFYRSFLALCLPLFLQAALQASVFILDSIMLGQLGELPMSASAMSNQPFNIVSGIIRGLTLGGGVLIAQYWGKGDRRAIRRVLSIGLKISLGIMAVATLIVSLFPGNILRIFTNAPEVVAAGIPYLRIVAFSYIFYAVSNTFLISLRSVENTRVPLFINLISYALNIFLNYSLIFGKFGFPELGLYGAAWGSLISKIVECLCFVYIIFIKDQRIKFRFRHVLIWDNTLFKDYMKYGIPSMASEFFFVLGASAYSMIFGRLGTVAIASNTVATEVIRISTLPMSGVCGAVAVMIGKTIGQGDLERVKLQRKTFNVITMGVGIFSTVFLMVFKKTIIGVYDILPETAEMANIMCTIAGITMIGTVFEILYVVGMQVGAGDTRYIFRYTTFVMWCIVMPAAFLGAFVFNWSVPVIYFVLRMDYVIKAVWGYFRTRGTKWIKVATRDDLEGEE